MKKMWQNFGNIFSILLVIWLKFVIVWQNTLCTVCHPAMAYHIGVVEWCNASVFYKNGVNLHACMHGRRKDFFPGGGH